MQKKKQNKKKTNNNNNLQLLLVSQNKVAPNLLMAKTSISLSLAKEIHAHVTDKTNCPLSCAECSVVSYVLIKNQR